MDGALQPIQGRYSLFKAAFSLVHAADATPEDFVELLERPTLGYIGLSNEVPWETRTYILFAGSAGHPQTYAPRSTIFHFP